MGVLNLVLRLYFHVIPRTKKLKIGFFNAALAGIVNISQFMEEIENLRLRNISLGSISFQFFLSSLNSWEIEILKFPCFYILSDCEDGLSRLGVCAGQRSQ